MALTLDGKTTRVAGSVPPFGSCQNLRKHSFSVFTSSFDYLRELWNGVLGINWFWDFLYKPWRGNISLCSPQTSCRVSAGSCMLFFLDILIICSVIILDNTLIPDLFLLQFNIYTERAWQLSWDAIWVGTPCPRVKLVTRGMTKITRVAWTLLSKTTTWLKEKATKN